MTIVTMQCNADAPVSWVAAASFNMEHAITVLSIGQHEWPEDTVPTTDDPHYFRLPFTPGPWHVGTPAMYPSRISRLTR